MMARTLVLLVGAILISSCQKSETAEDASLTKAEPIAWQRAPDDSFAAWDEISAGDRIMNKSVMRCWREQNGYACVLAFEIFSNLGSMVTIVAERMPALPADFSGAQFANSYSCASPMPDFRKISGKSTDD